MTRTETKGERKGTSTTKTIICTILYTKIKLNCLFVLF